LEPSVTALMGFDDDVMREVDVTSSSRLALVAVCGVVSIGLAALGLGYALYLALANLVVAIAVAVAAALFVWNLVRLHHAGSGYPAHRPPEGIDAHRPSLGSVVVFFALGLMITAPCAMFVVAPAPTKELRVRDDAPRAERRVDARSPRGLIATGDALAAHPVQATFALGLFALLFSAVAWLKFPFVRAVRAYERARHGRERARIAWQFDDGERAIVELLAPRAGFVAPQKRHFADPPYNTAPLFFGVAPDDAARDARFVRPWAIEDHVEAAPAAAPPVVDKAPEAAPAAKPVEAKSAPTPEDARPPPPVDDGALSDLAEEPEAKSVWDEPLEDDGGPPAVSFLDVGRLSAERARRYTDEVAPFIARITGRSEREVASLLRVAPDDTPVHKLFSEYTSVRSILMREAGFARAHGFNRFVSIIVGLDEAEVASRMASAPDDQRLTGVFARELGRRLLKKKQR